MGGFFYRPFNGAPYHNQRKSSINNSTGGKVRVFTIDNHFSSFKSAVIIGEE